MSDSAQRPGWYPDPDSNSGERWWNGVGWSETRRGGPNQPITATAPLSTPPSALPAPAPVWRQPSGGIPIPPPARTAAPSYPDPYAPSASGQGASLNPQALRGFVVGIVGIVINFLLIPSILAIVLSIRGLARARELPGVAGNGNGFAIAGIVLGVLGLIGSLFMASIVILALTLPPVAG